MTAQTLLTRYAAMLDGREVVVLEADGSLSDYTRRLARIKAELEHGRNVAEHGAELARIAEAVRRGRAAR